MPGFIRARLHGFLNSLLGTESLLGSVVWAHNQGLGRNLLLTRELQRACAAHGLTLVLHHHDWWFDNRWARWPEIRRAGFGSLAQVARTVFPGQANVRHVAINRADTAILRRHLGVQVAWLPNPADSTPAPPDGHVTSARRWLREKLGSAAPVWLMPCRLLRRKNLAEGLLLARWLRPEAWLVTTGGVTSAEERPYAERLAAAARRQGWRLRLALLEEHPRRQPQVSELLAASETVLLTSLQEGFGLPYLEAARARRPLIARALPNIAPDLAQFGFAFPQYYDELLVASSLFDWAAEARRQARLFRHWRGELPGAWRSRVGQPLLLAAAAQPQPIPFSRLTLTAQLEVLSHPAEASWELCLPLNPFLRPWRHLAAEGALRLAPWPRGVSRWLSGPAYARGFAQMLAAVPPSAAPNNAGLAAQEQFIGEKLKAANLYPLTWSPRT
jgi:glycosyltransferase involved in cell wall biosynthesis